MAPNVPALVAAIGLAVAVAASVQCENGDDESCAFADGPRQGSVMLQNSKKEIGTSQGEGKDGSKKTKMGPLKLRLDNLEKEVEALKDRTATLESEVMGGEGGGGGPPPEALVSSDEDESDDSPAGKKREAYRRVMSLLGSVSRKAKDTQEPTTIKDRTASLEADVGALKSAISTLENQVAGTVFSAQPALLQMQSLGSSLKSRIAALEEDVDSCRMRITTLEHTVVG